MSAFDPLRIFVRRLLFTQSGLPWNDGEMRMRPAVPEPRRPTRSHFIKRCERLERSPSLRPQLTRFIGAFFVTEFVISRSAQAASPQQGSDGRSLGQQRGREPSNGLELGNRAEPTTP